MMKKIVLINHTFQIPRFYRRWELFAQEHKDIDVVLLTPCNFKWSIAGSMIFGSDTELKGESVQRENFRIIPIKTKDIKYIGWISKEMVDYIKNNKPDVVYHLGIHSQISALQCIWAVRKYVPNGKAICFSMRGPALNLRLEKAKTTVIKWIGRRVFYLLNIIKLKYFNKYCDAVICHYPEAIKCFREEGFTKPIYMSTQVGVNPEYYHPDEEQRLEIRKRFNLSDSFVFGAAARFIPSKGLIDIVEALPEKGNWKCLLMGKGTDEFTSLLKNKIKERGLQDKIILTGYIEWDEIAKYWNAIDCALHVPNTTTKWEETFSLAIVQAMATAKPVIGNTSGSVPYQLGPDGIVIPEGDIPALHNAMQRMIDNPIAAKAIGEKMYKYAINCFSIQHLNNHFYKIIQDVMSSSYTESLIDMTKFED